MKSFIMILCIIIFIYPTYSQILDREAVIQDENFMYIGDPNIKQYFDLDTIPHVLNYKLAQLKFKNIKQVCTGDFNNDGYNELGILSLGNSTNEQDYQNAKFQIHVMESKAYEVLHPDNNYGNYETVHNQEGYSIPIYFDIKPRVKNNPIIRRYNQASEWNYTNFFAEAGNYADGTESNDEIVVLNANETNDALEISLFSNNNTSNQKWNYSFDKETYIMPYTVLENANLQIDNLMFVVTEQNLSSTDNLLLLSNDGGVLKVHRLQYDSVLRTWTLSFLAEHMQIEREKIKSIKNLVLQGSNNIAIIYDNDVNEQQILVVYGSTYSTLELIYQAEKSYINYDFLENVVAGDFNGDGDYQLAFFINNEADRIQQIFLMKKCSNCNYSYAFYQELATKNSLTMFDKNVMPFVAAVNYDYDIKGRDDLVAIYLEQDDNRNVNESDYQEFNTILGWRSLPEFSENDYMLEVTDKDANGELITKSMIPIGPANIRMISSKDTLVHTADHKNYGYYSDEYYTKMTEVYNTLFPDRRYFTDSYYDWWKPKSFPADNQSLPDETFDYFLNFDNALLEYLNKAERFGYKVMPFIDPFEVYSYDIADTVSVWYHQYNDLSDQGDIPEYFRRLLEKQEIWDHTALAGIYLTDEVHGKIDPYPTKDVWSVYYDHFIRNYNNYPGQVLNNPNYMEDVCNNAFDLFKSNIPNKPLFINYLSGGSNVEYYDIHSDAVGIDVYPYQNMANHLDSLIIVNQQYGSSINAYARRITNKMIRENKDFCCEYLQAWNTKYHPVSSVDNKDTMVYADIENPSSAYLRWALFGSTMQGVRGHVIWEYPNAGFESIIHSRMYYTLKEFNFYKGWFASKSLKNFITNDHSRNNGSQKWRDINNLGFYYFYSDMYINNSVPIILTSYAEGNELNTEAVKTTAYLPNLTSSTVYLLSPDYWANGLYEIVPSIYDGNFVEFTDTLNGREIRIYAVGQLPPWDKPDEFITGEFGNSNQQQLIAYPIEQAGQDDTGSIDSLVRYHTVYQKLDTLRGITNIYYRRSLPTSCSIPSNLIEWEHEILLSDSIAPRNSIGINRNHSLSFCYECANKVQLYTSMNPSLVVRWNDETRRAEVFVTYNSKISYNEDAIQCNNQGIKTDQYIIAECVFPANSLFQDYKYDPYQLATFTGDFETHGCPVINASDLGNYYAWADRKNGIIVAYKNTNDKCFNSVLDSASFRWHSGTYSYALHPSINTYSRFTEDHDNIALVWQEKPNGASDDDFDIYYTRISRFNPDNPSDVTLQNYLTNDSCHECSHGFNYDKSKQMIELSTLWGTQNHQFPVVYRGVELETEGWRRELDLHERIFWNSYDIPTGNNTIGFAYIDYIDSSDSQFGYVPYCRTYMGPWHIRGINKNLKNPVVVQGKMKEDPFDFYSIHSDSMYVLNFVDENKTETNSTIWQINDSYWGMIYNWETIQTDFTEFASEEYVDKSFNSHRRRFAKPVIGYGNNPQLSAMPFMTGKHSWSLNRRLFEVGREPYTEIVPSYEHFAKATIEDETEHHLVGFAFKNNKLCVVSRIAIVNRETGDYQKLFYYPSVDQDTIYSSFFDINPDDDVVFYSHKDFDNNRVKLYLKLQGSEELIHIPVNKSINHQFTKLRYGFSDQLTKAQFVLVPKSPEYWIYKEMVLGGLPELDKETTTSPKMLFADNDKTVLDVSSSAELFQVKAYPNPTYNGKMNLKIASNVTDQCLKSVVYQITDLNGKIVDTFTANSTDILHLELSKYESNILIISAKTTDDCSNKTIESTVKVIVQ